MSTANKGSRGTIPIEMDPLIVELWQTWLMNLWIIVSDIAVNYRGKGRLTYPLIRGPRTGPMKGLMV